MLIAVRRRVPLFVKDVYVQNIMVLTLMYAALSQSWNILGGYCGQISLGHALYFGLGAYTTAILFTKFGVLPWFGMLGRRLHFGGDRAGARLSDVSGSAGTISRSPPSSSRRSHFCCFSTGIGPVRRSASTSRCGRTAG